MPTYFSEIDNAKIAGNYDLDKTIGKGHFAIVKLAKHVFTGEMVAVKIIDKTKLDPVAREHLFQEVICMKLVQHPHVVRLYEVIDTVHKLYLIQEWGDGGDLYDYIMKHENGLPENQAKTYFAQILNAIAYCHKLHVVHRDLKPENVVFFRKEGVVKLTDFGFSNKFTPGTHLETSCGSLAYSAPEILLGDSYDPPKVDIWSLGVILYMLVCGQLPFQEANDSETLTKIMDCHYTFPSQLGSTCEQLIRLMLCRDPTKRATLDEILAHPWFHGTQIDQGIDVTPLVAEESALSQAHLHSVTATCCRLPLVCQHKFSYEEHMELLNLMADGNVATQAEIQASLDDDRYDYLTATYFLLAERKLRRRHPVSIVTSEVSSSCNPVALAVPSDQLSNPIQQSIVSQANVSVRVLTPESDTCVAPEDRLRRFSMILEDQEEEEEDLEDDEEMDGMDVGKRTSGIIFEDEDEEEQNASATNTFVEIPHTVPVRKMSSTSEARHSSSYRERILMIQQKAGMPRSYELGEFIELNSQGVATLRFFKASVWGLTSCYSSGLMSSRASSVSRRRRSKMSTLCQIHSMPHLLQGILEESGHSTTGSTFQKSSINGDNSTRRPVSFDIANWQRGASVPLRGASESTTGSSTHSGFSKYHWRARIKRRSLPPLGTISPSGYRRQKKKLNYCSASETSTAVSKSHSNSSESSDTENPSRLQSHLGDRSILECIEVNSPQCPSSTNPYNQVANFFSSQATVSHGSVTRTSRSAAAGLGSNQSGSSSGINLRDNYAPIHEDVETESASSQTHVGRFHHSFSMTPTPNPSGWNVVAPYVSHLTQPISRTEETQYAETTSHQLDYGRRRSDYGHVNTRPGSGADTPARHSVHGLSSHRCFVPLPSNGVAKSKHSSGRSMSQSNFSLSSLANSLRASKMMMEVIRGTYELQMYQQRSKAASSISSSTQQIHQGEGSKTSPNHPFKEESSNHSSISQDPVARDKVSGDPRPSSDSTQRTTAEGDVVTEVLKSPRFGLYPEKRGHSNMNNGGSSVGRMHGNGFENNVANSMPAFPVYSYDRENRSQSINDGDTNNVTVTGSCATEERRDNVSKMQCVESHSLNTPCRRIRTRRACCILS